MVNAITACLLTFAALGQPSEGRLSEEPDPETNRAVSSALHKGSYPWYDSERDAVKPLTLPRVPKGWNFPSWLGNVLSMTGLLIALGALIGVLVWFWRIYEPTGEGSAESSKERGEPSRVEALPEGMRREFESSDPWAEALRRRARGDLAGAVVCLFAHQLLTLSRLGLVRLAPGRTGRQLLRAVADIQFRGLVQPTLRQFEAVYYGHRIPTPEEFAVVWESAEAFERRVAEGVAA